MSASNPLLTALQAECARHVSGPLQRLQGSLCVGGACTFQTQKQFEATPGCKVTSKKLSLVVASCSETCPCSGHGHDQLNFFCQLHRQCRAAHPLGHGTRQRSPTVVLELVHD